MKTVFPTKVWEPTGRTRDGITLWSSRIATREDFKRRQNMVDWLDRDNSPELRLAAKELLQW